MKDLLPYPELLPQSVLDLIDRFEQESESGDSYAAARKLSRDLALLGYSVDYGLDGELYDLIDTNRE